MISIEEAIKKSKELPNISNGGSACYDLGDVVLVKYILPLEYVRPGYRARQNQESVMEGVNEKSIKGVNTPKHIDMRRIIEGEDDICYVLQEKCKGKNCASMAISSASLERVLEDLKCVTNIPFEHYTKLVSDACMLYEMGYEKQNKNLFYDEKTGFWFIDFLCNKVDQRFDANDPKKIFETLKYSCPKPLQIASRLKHNSTVSIEDKEKINNLTFSSNAKFFLACKKAVSTFSKYEFFYLMEEDDDFKRYLMDNGFVNRNLFSATNDDFELYNELFTSVVNDICQEISAKGYEYWEIEMNGIRNESGLFSLSQFYGKYIRNDLNRADYEDEWEYERAINKCYENEMMDSIYSTLCSMETNENISKFILEYKSKRDNKFIVK